MIVGIIVGIVAVAVIVGFVFCQSAEFREGSSRRTVGEDKEVASLQRRRIPESAQYGDDDFPKGTFGSFLGILI